MRSVQEPTPMHVQMEGFSNVGLPSKRPPPRNSITLDPRTGSLRTISRLFRDAGTADHLQMADIAVTTDPKRVAPFRPPRRLWPDISRSTRELWPLRPSLAA